MWSSFLLLFFFFFIFYYSFSDALIFFETLHLPWSRLRKVLLQNCNKLVFVNCKLLLYLVWEKGTEKKKQFHFWKPQFFLFLFPFLLVDFFFFLIICLFISLVFTYLFLCVFSYTYLLTYLFSYLSFFIYIENKFYEFIFHLLFFLTTFSTVDTFWNSQSIFLSIYILSQWKKGYYNKHLSLVGD